MLQIASQRGQEHVVAALLKKGALKDVQSPKGKTKDLYPRIQQRGDQLTFLNLPFLAIMRIIH